MLKFHYRNNTCLAASTQSATMPHMAVPSRRTTRAPNGLLHDSSAPALPHALYSVCMHLLHTLYPASCSLSGAGQASPTKATPRCPTPGCAQAGRCPLQAERYAGQPPALALLLLAPGVRLHQGPAGAPLPAARVRALAVPVSRCGWRAQGGGRPRLRRLDRPSMVAVAPRRGTGCRQPTAATPCQGRFASQTDVTWQQQRGPPSVVLCARNRSG